MPAFTRSRKRKASEEVFMMALQFVAENGWLPWTKAEHENLRLVSRSAKMTVDEAAGPHFEEIVDMLNRSNGFNRESGACHYCTVNRRWSMTPSEKQEKCQTCVAKMFGACNCPEDHRFPPILLKMDPRLNSNFALLSSRERAKRLLRFCRWCVSNFLQRFENKQDEEDYNTMDLTLVDPDFSYHDFGDFGEQLKEFNRPIFNLLHNLLFIGMNVNDLGFFEATSTSPWDVFSPFRTTFLYGSDAEEVDKDYEHNMIYKTMVDNHEEMVHEFLQVHQPAKEEEIVVTYGDEEGQGLTASQVRYIPEVIRRCIGNSIHPWAQELLGPQVAASIDIYHPAWTTLCENDISLEWMPCLGGDDDSSYAPLESFDGYNPRTRLISHACGLDMYAYD
jgi:hypothetical protein